MKNEMESPEAQLMSMSQAFMRSQILFTGVELGVFEELAKKPATPAEAAKRLKISLRGADILFHALASLDLLEKKGEKFRLSPVADKCLVNGRPGYMGNIIRHSANLQAGWSRLADVVREGHPAFPRPTAGKTDEGRQALRNFILGMADLAEPMARAMVDRLDLRGVRRTLDVGGGPGTYTFALIRKKPDIEGAIFDMPHVIPITIEQIERHGLQSKIGTIQGDFNVDGLGSGYDLVVMSNVLHSNSPAECKKLVKKGFNALNPGGRLVINEFTLRRNRTGPPIGAIFSVNMLVGTPGGSSYSSEEITGWMKAAGFGAFEKFELMGRSTVVVGRKSAARKKK